MARRRFGRRHRKGFKIPILTLAILAGQAGVAWHDTGGDLKSAASAFAGYYTGFDLVNFGSGFDARRLVVGYAPWLVKGLVMKVARPLGAAPKMPFGLPVSFS